MTERILVIAAHPDDETLGAGGTISQHIDQGDEVKVIILGTGIASRNDENLKEEIVKLRENSKKAVGILGVKEIKFYDYPDNSFDTVPLLKIIKTIEDNIEEFKPTIVYTHHKGDLNIDHRITFEAVLTATRPTRDLPTSILSFEVLSSSEWSFGSNGLFNPNYFVDITQTIDKKLNALMEYEGEVRKAPHPRSTEIIDALAKLRGSMSNSLSAEAFEIVRMVKK